MSYLTISMTNKAYNWRIDNFMNFIHLGVMYDFLIKKCLLKMFNWKNVLKKY